MNQNRSSSATKLSFCRHHCGGSATRQTSDWFNTAVTDDRFIRIGLAYGWLADFLPEHSEASNPIVLNRADRARLDYLALGDWHGCLKVGERTCYSGTPEPDRFRANESGYVLDVAIERPRPCPALK